MKLKKLLSILLASLIIMSSLSVVNVFAQTDTNQTETAETTDSTSEPTSVATETTEPTSEVTQPATEVTEVTEPTANSTETTVPTGTTDSTTETLPPTYSDKEIISGDYIYEVIMDNEIKIVDYFGTDTNVIVPAQIDGYDVTTIEGGAFICKSNVESVTLPEGVRYIDNYAFYGCKNLRNVTLPNTLLIIEKAAFRCTQITDIEIPDSVGVIRSNAFARTKLRNIKIGRGINTIEDGALGEEKTLTITGYSNTEAEKYAIRNDVKFISIDEPQPTTPQGNVTFNVDEGVCANYERIAYNGQYLYIIYTYESTDYLYRAGKISVKVNGEKIDSITEEKISVNPTIETYQFFAKTDDNVEINVSKGAIAEDKRFEFIYDDYLISNNIEGDYIVHVNRMTNVAHCKVIFYIDNLEYGVDAQFYVNDVEIEDVDGADISNNGHRRITYTFSVCASDKIVVKANSFVIPVATKPTTETTTPTETTEPTTETTEPTTEVTKPTEPVTTPTEGTEPTEAVEKKANPVKVTVKNTSVSAKKLESKKQTVNPITVKDAKGTVEVVKVKSSTTSKIYKKITVNKKTGAITFSKGKYAKKTYSIKLKITAKGNSEYKSKVITKTVKVKVK